MIAFRQNRSRRAVILLLTIWIVIVLGLLAQSLSYEMRVESQLSALNRDQFRVRQLARLGVARATTDLRNDNLLMGAADMDWRNRFDAFGDVWADGSLLPRTYEITPPDDSDPIGHYTILVVDEESKLDINNEKTMEAIEYLIRMLGEDEEDARDIAEAIWDWKDNDDEPIGKKGTSEIEHYARELDMDLDVESSRLYLPKNAKFDTVDELLGIPGMTPELFYGYDPEEEEPSFFPDLDAEPRSRNRRGLREFLTVKADKLNINTASYECLAALFGQASGSLETGKSIAQSIIDKRQGRGSTRIDNSSAFKKINELGALTGMSAFVGKAGQLQRLTTQSDFFTIYCEARLGEAEEKSVWTSGNRNEKKRPKPIAKIVAGAYRSAVNYTGEDLEDWMPPGFQTRSVQREDGSTITSWSVPVVYYTSWNIF